MSEENLGKLEFYAKTCQKLIDLSNYIKEDNTTCPIIEISLGTKRIELKDEQKIIRKILAYVKNICDETSKEMLKESIPKILTENK